MEVCWALAAFLPIGQRVEKKNEAPITKAYLCGITLVVMSPRGCCFSSTRVNSMAGPRLMVYFSSWLFEAHALYASHHPQLTNPTHTPPSCCANFYVAGRFA